MECFFPKPTLHLREVDNLENEGGSLISIYYPHWPLLMCLLSLVDCCSLLSQSQFPKAIASHLHFSISQWNVLFKAGVLGGGKENEKPMVCAVLGALKDTKTL